MRKYLTVSETAKLLNISAHTIRYYDKEGLISLKHDDENEYRLFDYDDIYLLSTVIMLRESGIPIKDIRALLKDYSVNEYKRLLQTSKSHIDNEIKKLKKLKMAVQDKLNNVDKLKDVDKEFNRITLPKRYFRQIKKSDFKMNYSLKELYDIYVDKKIDMSKLYKGDIIYIIDENNITLCMQQDKPNNYDVISYDAGEYIDYTVRVYNDNELYKRIEEMFYYFSQESLDVEGDMIMILGFDAAMTDTESYIAHLQLKIK